MGEQNVNKMGGTKWNEIVNKMGGQIGVENRHKYGFYDIFSQ